jgi:cytochrome c biogenesis protein CcdA
LYDFFRFKKTKDTSGAILQLPKFLKKKINLAIGSRLREKENKGIAGLVISSFIVGLTVSVLEGACTGQVYWPILLVIWENPSLRLKGFSYLLLYNLMFIVPLILIFILFLLGVNSQVFNNFLKKHLGLMKILMALLFFVLGSIILLRPYISSL